MSSSHLYERYESEYLNIHHDKYYFGILLKELLAAQIESDAWKNPVISSHHRDYALPDLLLTHIEPALLTTKIIDLISCPELGFKDWAPQLKKLIPSDKEMEEAVREVLRIYHRHPDLNEPLSQHVFKMKRVSQQLGDMIRRTDDILMHLYKMTHLTLKEYNHILSQSMVYDRAESLIHVLHRKPVAAYHDFLEALIQTDQPHLFSLLEDGIGNFDHREILIDHYIFLKENLTFSKTVSETNLLANLQSLRVLDEKEMNEIQSKNSEQDKVVQLFQYILRTSHKQYKCFLEALNVSNLQSISERLKVKTEPVKARLVHTIPVRDYLLGLTEYQGSILVTSARHNSATVLSPPTDTSRLIFFNRVTLDIKKEVLLNTPDAPYDIDLSHIAGDPIGNCIYFKGESSGCIWKFSDDTMGNGIQLLNQHSDAFSVTTEGNVLTLVLDPYYKATTSTAIHVYRPTGSVAVLVKTIRITGKHNIHHPEEVVQIKSGRYIILYKSRPQLVFSDMIAVVSAEGQVLETYTEEWNDTNKQWTKKDSGIGAVNTDKESEMGGIFTSVTADDEGFVYISHIGGRILVLDSNLRSCTVIDCKDHSHKPLKVLYSLATCRLIVACATGQLDIYNIS